LRSANPRGKKGGVKQPKGTNGCSLVRKLGKKEKGRKRIKVEKKKKPENRWVRGVE